MIRRHLVYLNQIDTKPPGPDCHESRFARFKCMLRRSNIVLLRLSLVGFEK
jgi:hypothetical protein